jgi:hypothetical protein
MCKTSSYALGTLLTKSGDYTQNPCWKVSECNGDISPFETIAYPGGGSDNFRVADNSRSDLIQHCECMAI